MNFRILIVLLLIVFTKLSAQHKNIRPINVSIQLNILPFNLGVSSEMYQ